MNLDDYKNALKEIDIVRVVGRVVKVVGLVIDSNQGVSIGDLCMVEIIGGDMIRASRRI